MRIFLEPFYLTDERKIFERIYRQYNQITKFDYIKYDFERVENLNLCIPDARKAYKKFGTHNVDFKKITKYDERYYELVKEQESFAETKIDNPTFGFENARLKYNQRKRRALVLFYYFLWQLKDYDALFIWNGFKLETQTMIEAAKILEKKITYWELGPFKNTLTLEKKGVNYNNSMPREIEFYRNWSKSNPDMGEEITIGTRKQEFIPFATTDMPDLSKPYIFLPLQVFMDTQIIFFNDWVKNIPHLIEIAKEVSKQLPEGFRILMKEHPTCYSRYNKEAITDDNLLLANGYDTPTLIENAKIILTLNSSVGLEAMLFNKPIITLGKSFYAFGGLTHQCANVPEIIEAIKCPNKIKFNPEDRKAFLNYIKNEYYLDGNLNEEGWVNSKKNQKKLKEILGLEWRETKKHQNGESKNLVMTTTINKRSYHEKMLRRNRNWDFLLCDASVDEMDYYDIDEVIYFNNRSKGGFFDSIYKAFKKNPSLLETYEYIMIVENHIKIDCQTVNRCFEMMKEYNLQLATPSSSRAESSDNFQLYNVPEFKLRYVNYVPSKNLCMDMKLFKKTLPFFNNNPLGFDIEKIAAQLVDDADNKIAILDEIICQNPLLNPTKWHWEFLGREKDWHAPQQPEELLSLKHKRPVSIAGILADGTKINNPDKIYDILNQSWQNIKNEVPKTQTSQNMSLEAAHQIASGSQKRISSRSDEVSLQNFYKKNLVIVRAGETSLHGSWLGMAEERNWDIVVSSYCDENKWIRGDVLNLHYVGGNKDGVYNVFQQMPELLDQYEYFMIADDDFAMTFDKINRLFEMMREYNLQIAQPSLTHDSYITYWQSLHNPVFKIRYTNFCEANTVGLHRSLLVQVLPLWEDNPLAWFIDNFWSRLTDNPKTQVAVIDDIQITHTRPYHSGDIYKKNWEEEGPHRFSVLKYYADNTDPRDGPDIDKLNLKKILTHHAVLKNGKKIKGRWLILFPLVWGWIKIAKHTNSKRILNNRSVRTAIRDAFRNQIKSKRQFSKTRIFIHGRK